MIMKINRLTTIAVAFGFSMALAYAEAPVKNPNIIFILADDMGIDLSLIHI